jgi:phosphomannomutase
VRRRLIGFDLDGTLAVTKSPIPDLIAERLASLLAVIDVCVVSGGDFSQFEKQVIARLDVVRTDLARLHLLPTTGTKYFRYDPVAEAWGLQYSEDLAPESRDAAIGALTAAAKSLGYWEPHPTGEIIEDRGSQVTFSALGQQASPEAKYAWDPDGSKRRSMRDRVAAALPDLEVHVGGQTSIDVTNSGVDKAFAMRKLMGILGLSAADVLFFGDQLDEGGNDYPVKAIGIDTITVRDWHDSALAIEAIVAVNP